MNKIISFGGGVNSVAMTIMLYERGERWPIVFADTGAEQPETYCYLKTFESWLMDKHGASITRLHPKITPEYYSPRNRGLDIIEFCREKKIIPWSGMRWCTDDYKQVPLHKHSPGLIRLIGIAADEAHRAKRGPGFEHPLVDEGIDRVGCKKIIVSAGLTVPIKSGCFICPFQPVPEWKRIWMQHPDLFAIAMELEANTAKNGLPATTIRTDGYSLTKMVFNWTHQMEMPGFIEAPEDYMSCMCGR